MTKIWTEGYLAPYSSNDVNETPPRVEQFHLRSTRSLVLFTTIGILASLSVGMGILAEPVLALLIDAAEQLLDPDVYVDAVLGEES